MTSGGAAFAQRCRVPRPGGGAGFIMIKKIQPVVEKKIQPVVVSYKLQASGARRQATLDNGSGIV